MSASDSVRRSLVVASGTLIRVYVAGSQPYWISDGLIGTDDPDQDVTHWSEVVAGRLSPVKSMTTTDEQYDIVQAVIDAGLDEAGIVDVPNCTCDGAVDPRCRRHRGEGV